MAKITFTDKVSLVTNPAAIINKVVAGDLNEIKASVNALYDFVPAEVAEYVVVGSIDDLPAPVGGVITLLANAAYFFVTTIDLVGSRLVGSANTTLLGTSSETSIITSTGLGVGVPLFTTSFTTPIRHISFKDVDTALAITARDNLGEFNWTGVNFVNIPNVGILNGGSNLIFTKGAIVNSLGLVFTGTWASIVLDSSFFLGTGSAGNVISIDSNAVITRRFRTIYSSLVAFGSSVAINVSALASIPIESFILDTVNFSGGGTYLGGLISDSVYSLFVNCIGVRNTYTMSNYVMNGNAILTDIVSTGVPVKVAGVTTSNALSQKFTNTSNRATYNGGFPRIFDVTAIASVTSASSNDQIGFYLAKNGVALLDTVMVLTTNTSNRAENTVIQTIVELSNGDYIEIFIANATDTSDVTVTHLNVLTKSI